MLIIALLKGVPARTTRVVTVAGVLRREEMDIVMNPHDVKAIQAADYAKRRAGGKIISLTMGPDVKLAPIMSRLYDAEVEGVDEAVILSDRRMAGADTLATAYTVSFGIKRVLDVNLAAIDQLIVLIRDGASAADLEAKSHELYSLNLIPNMVFSELPAVRSSIINDFISGKLTVEDAISQLKELQHSLRKFLVVTGVKTTDGETGSVGPQVAEALSDIYGFYLPHITYVQDFEIDPVEGTIVAERKISRSVQVLETRLPTLLTIGPEYRSRVAPAGFKKHVREHNYKEKVRNIVKWDATTIGADLRRIGLPGSPTLVGPGVDIGKPLSQRILGKSLVFKDGVESLVWQNHTYGPFARGDPIDGLPEGLKQELLSRGLVEPLGYQELARQLFGDLKIAIR